MKIGDTIFRPIGSVCNLLGGCSICELHATVTRITEKRQILNL